MFSHLGTPNTYQGMMVGLEGNSRHHNVCIWLTCDYLRVQVIQSCNKSIRISCKGLSETPLHFIIGYKGDSVGRYRRYPLLRLQS